MKDVPQRYIMVAMSFIVILNLTSVRTNLPLTLIQMVEPVTHADDPTDQFTCPVDHITVHPNGTLESSEVGGLCLTRLEYTVPALVLFFQYD